MTRAPKRKVVKAQEATQQPTPPTHDELPNASGSDREIVEKDTTELKLEKLVFGDDAGFREGLKSYRQDAGISESSEEEEEEEEEEAVDDGATGEEEEEEDMEGVHDADLFFLDSGPSTNLTKDLILAQPLEEEHETGEGDPPAWVDSDDERISISLASNPRLRKLRRTEGEDIVNGREYTKRLREQFERLYPVPEWANPSAFKSSSRKKRRRASRTGSGSENDSSADEMSTDSDPLSAQPLAKLLQNASSFKFTPSSTKNKLRPEIIDIQRSKDVGGAQPSAITSLSFHPYHPLLLSSGPSSTLSLHHISPSSPSPNPLLQTLHIRSTPLTTSLFSPQNGSKIFFSGRRRYFHIWDLESGKIEKVSRVYGHENEQRSMERFKLSGCGRWIGLVGSGRKGGGVVNVLDKNTCQWIAQVRVEGKGGIADFAWWADGEGMVVLGKSGEAVEWSLRERRVLARWIDEGAVGTTVVALGGSVGNAALGGDRWIAVGSQSGIVNVYERSPWLGKDGVPERPVPRRSFKQLTTPTSHLLFSPDGQLLVLASRWKRDALRLVHLPSCTVYKNWPTAGTPLGRITAVALSPNSEMLAVANEQGKIRLWEIRG